jgi:hypothetical protein
VEQTYGISFLLRQERRFDFSDLEAGHFIPGVNMPVWRIPFRYDAVRDIAQPEDLLFNNRLDPEQMNNVAGQHPDVVRQLEDLLRSQALAVQAPQAQFQRLRL